jgi:hypothetical protein
MQEETDALTREFQGYNPFTGSFKAGQEIAK